MKESIFLYLVGTAGSGKSTLTGRFKEWFELRGLDAITVNLDPGAERLSYTPDVDIRNWISLKEVMDEYGLGPNGAQVVCADMIALNTKRLQEEIETFRTDYVLLDTPGQIELFVFREAGRHLISFLNPKRNMVAYLIDPALTKTPSGFVSQLLLSITTRFRLNAPMVNILSKRDLIEEEVMRNIEEWSSIDDRLYETLLNEDPSLSRELSEQIFSLLRHFGEGISLIPISSSNFTGMEDLYTSIQMYFKGGEDTLSD
jgi:hypothetical protein